MPSLPDCYGIIPARFESTRFPGKPLAKILGKPMFWHVFTRASRCPLLKRVVLATDDLRIAAAAKELDVPAVMTRGDHASGTDRVLEAAGQLDITGDAVVVNIQGDEPALNPEMITQLIAPFTDSRIRVTTLARPIDRSAAGNPDQVKVVAAENGDALYFSRAPIPFAREGAAGPFLGHIGLYAFRLDALRQFVGFAPSRLESIEKLEQLRLLENGIPIRVVVTDYVSIGVDRPEDVEKVERALNAGLSG